MPPAWIKPGKTTAHITAPTGEMAAIRPIDSDFWNEEGNIEIFRYFKGHDEYLNKLHNEDRILYHYTNLSGLHGIVKDCAIWATDVRHLNDRAELNYALENMRALLIEARGATCNPQPLDAIFRPARTWRFVTCLSRSRDQLSQWRAYGKRIGIAIAFDREHLTHAVDAQGGTVVDCRYFGREDFAKNKSDWEPILQALGRPGVLNNDGALIDMPLQEELTRRAVHIAASIKHPSFVEEQEVRLVFSKNTVSDDFHFRSSDQSLAPYIKIDLDGRRVGTQPRRRFANHLGMLEVTVWPRDIDDQILDAIDALMSNAGHVLVNRSDSPYRT